MSDAAIETVGKTRSERMLDGIERVTGRPVPHRIGSRRPGDPPVLVADPALAKEKLGWSARLSDLNTIVETAWRWHQRPGHHPRHCETGHRCHVAVGPRA